MFKRTVFVISLFICLLSARSLAKPGTTTNYPIHVIFDTDFGPDYDDVGAITLLHVLPIAAI